MDSHGVEVTFMFQFGLIRDAVTVPQASINLKTIKDLACDFINARVGIFLCFFILINQYTASGKSFRMVNHLSYF